MHVPENFLENGLPRKPLSKSLQHGNLFLQNKRDYFEGCFGFIYEFIYKILYISIYI